MLPIVILTRFERVVNRSCKSCIYKYHSFMQNHNEFTITNSINCCYYLTNNMDRRKKLI